MKISLTQKILNVLVQDMGYKLSNGALLEWNRFNEQKWIAHSQKTFPESVILKTGISLYSFAFCESMRRFCQAKPK